MIFSLPKEFADYPTPLAYIWWFRGISSRDRALGMYKIAASTRGGGHANTAVIPITHIVRSCHLIPAFGEQIDRSWTRENILRQSANFFLNPYVRHLDFFLLRYLDTADDSDKIVC